MHNPLVSIITPAYNHEKYIAQCIDSVLAQSFTDWEMIIINDGSTDKTAVIVLEYVSANPKIKLINQDNIGVFRLSETYNKALADSKGKYIAILEGDDLWEAGKLERQVASMERDESVVLAWGKAQLVSHDLTTIFYEAPQINRPLSFYNNIPYGAILDLYMAGQFIPAVTITIRKSYLDQIGGFVQSPNTPLVDFTTIVELSAIGNFHFDNFLLGKWRIYPTQTTKKYTVEIYSGIKKFLENHFSKTPTVDPARKDAILNHYDKLCLEAYARSGRYKLIRKEYKSARQDYIKAIGYPANGKMVWRLRALVGYAMSLFHLDVEWIAKIMGRKTYKGSDK